MLAQRRACCPGLPRGLVRVPATRAPPSAAPAPRAIELAVGRLKIGLFQEIQTLLKLSLSLFHYLISPFPAPNDEAAGREERDLGGIYCTVKPGWKRRIPSDLRS